MPEPVASDGPAVRAEVRCLRPRCGFGYTRTFGSAGDVKRSAKSHATENPGHKVEVTYGHTWWYLKFSDV